MHELQAELDTCSLYKSHNIEIFFIIIIVIALLHITQPYGTR